MGTTAYIASAVFNKATNTAHRVASHGAGGGNTGLEVPGGGVLDVVCHEGDHGCGGYLV